MTVKDPESLLTDDEEILHQFRPHWKVLLPAIGWAMLLAAIAGFVAAVLPDRWSPSWSFGWSFGIALALWLAVSTKALVAWYATNYVLTNERIVVRQGLIARNGTEIPLENITNVLFSQRVIERMLGYGDVLIESAGSQGQSRLSDITDPESFQSEVYRARELRTLHFRSSGNVATRDVVQQLEALADLRERGHLSDEEFASKKRQLLGDLPGVDPAEVQERVDEGKIDPTL